MEHVTCNIKTNPENKKRLLRTTCHMLRDERGAAALITVLITITLSLLFMGFISFSWVNSQKIISNKINSQKIFYSSEAGLEDNIYRIKNQKNYTATNTLPVGSGQTNITITSDGSTKTILSEGVFGSFIRRLQSIVEITTSEVSFHYGVQVGAGGLQTNQNATVQGNIYSNGPIVGQSGAKITGDAYVATAMSIVDQWTIQNNETLFGKQTPVLDVAQSFRPASSGTLAQVSLYLKKTGNPGDVTVMILTDNGSGSPSKTSIASATLQASKVTTSYGWVDVAFPSLPNLTANTTYWIMIDTNANNSKYWYWGKDSNQGNGNGVSKYSDDWNAGSPTWTTDPGDYNYKIWFGTGINGISNFIVHGDVHANTITNTQICGNAYYQTIDAASTNFLNSPTNLPCPLPLTPGTAYPGSADPAVQNMPVSDGNITQWEQDALAGGTITDPSGTCIINDGAIIGPAKYACDLAIANNVNVTVNGPIWVEGNILINNNVKMILNPGFGSSGTVIIADYPANRTLKGSIRTTNNIAICGSAGYNSQANECNPSGGSYIMMLSTYSGTTTKAIAIENNVEGGIFYAAYGSAELENNASVKEIIAYKLELENNVTIVYESGLANANFSSGPGASWKIESWKEVE